MLRERIGFTPAPETFLLQISSAVDVKPGHNDRNGHVNNSFYPGYCVLAQNMAFQDNPEISRLSDNTPISGMLHVLYINEAREGDTINIDTKVAADPLGTYFTHHLTRNNQDIATVRWIVSGRNGIIHPTPFLQVFEQARGTFLDLHPKMREKLKEKQWRMFIPELLLTYGILNEKDKDANTLHATSNGARITFEQTTTIEGIFAALTCDVIVVDQKSKPQRITDLAKLLEEEFNPDNP